MGTLVHIRYEIRFVPKRDCLCISVHMNAYQCFVYSLRIYIPVRVNIIGLFVLNLYKEKTACKASLIIL